MSEPAGATFRIESLLREDAFPHPVSRLELRETRLSWVILTGAFAYKIKKPVRLEFVDASTLERRHELCEAELRLNRRLAADLYVDVVPIRSARGVTRIGGDGILIEYAVRMHQFDSSQELIALLERSAVTLPQLTDLARRLAAFHAAAACATQEPDEYLEEVRGIVRDNITTLSAHLADPPAELSGIVHWMLEALEQCGTALRDRAAAGRVREGHGDLHARNIVLWKERLTPFDCLEFAPRLRQLDVLDDVTFLVMDLTSYARRDLACALLSAYLEASGDYEGVPLVPLYAVHRALVRAMVDALLLEEHPGRAELIERLRRRLRAALTFQQPARPSLLIMNGLSGSGKSWLSEQLIAPVQALRIRSDLERKRIELDDAGVAARAAGAAQRYTSERNRATYARLERAAAAVIAGGFNALVDAAFLRREDRERFRALATRLGARFRIIHCQADVATLRARIERRASEALDPSEATAAVLERQLREAQPLAPEEQADALEIDTRAPHALERAVGMLCA